MSGTPDWKGPAQQDLNPSRDRAPESSAKQAVMKTPMSEQIIAARASDRAAFTEPSTIVRVYEAAFGLKPDAEGWAFWVDALSSDEGPSVWNLAQSVVASETFLTRFSNYQTRSDFIETLYEKILNRSPDDAGELFWNKSNYSDSELLYLFSESAEFEAMTKDAVTNFFLDISISGKDDPTGSDQDDYSGSIFSLDFDLPPILL